MTAIPARDHTVSSERAFRPLAIFACVLLVVGLLSGESTERVLTYLLVVAAALLPSVLWIRAGATGIPIFPIVAAGYIPYFAWPLLSGGENTLAYTEWEIVRSGLTVALFLAIGTGAWRLVGAGASYRHTLAPDHADPDRAARFVLAGLGVGVLYHAGLILNLFGELGSLFGLVRSIAVTFVTAACFLLGVTRAQGVLRGPRWGAAIAGLALITLMSWSSLFLVGGMLYLLAAGMGFVLVAKRVPVVTFGVLFALVAVLHVGKSEMRDRYWIQNLNFSDSRSAMQLPGLMIDWLGEGVYRIATGNFETSIVDRASLIQMLLLAQSDTPDRVDYLMGETYAMLPQVLVPRFIDADKPASQVGMDLLNIRYGILTSEEAASTAVGWGPVAEAFANFGYLGVIGVALVLGGICGALARWSASSEITSIPTLASISTMLVLLNIEADSVQIFASSLQSFAAVLIFSVLYRWFSVPRKGEADLRGDEISVPGMSQKSRKWP